MKKMLLISLFTLIAGPAWAVCSGVTENSTEKICLNNGGGDCCVRLSDLKIQSLQLQAAEMQNALQRRCIDQRQRLTSLPSDDPDRWDDPGLPGLFHSDTDGVKLANELEHEWQTARCADIEITVDANQPSGFQVRASDPQ